MNINIGQITCAPKLKRGLRANASLHFSGIKSKAYVTVTCDGPLLPKMENDGGSASARFSFELYGSSFRHKTDCRKILELLGDDDNDRLTDYFLKRKFKGMSLEVRSDGTIWTRIKIGRQLTEPVQGHPEPDYSD